MTTIKLPSLIMVNDYHEFANIKSVLVQFGVKCKYVEVGFAYHYMAVFYNTSKSDPKVKKLILEGKDRERSFNLGILPLIQKYSP